MQIFVDLDGVLADFDKGYERLTGAKPDKSADNVNWDVVRQAPDFYLDLPMMEDALELWEHVRKHDPAVLTGLPWSIPSAAPNKRDWVAKHLGTSIEVITCPSRDKCLHASPGDILIDDWEKYRQRWIDRGGVWITHKSAKRTIHELKLMGL